MTAFDKTQKKLDELRNLTWQNGKLIEQNETLTKMLEEKDDSTLVVEINEAKRVLADAINTKGGEASAESSFQQLAEDIQTLPYAGISAEGIVQTEEFSFLKYLTSEINNKIVSINDSTITEITRPYAFYNNIALTEVLMSEVYSISGIACFSKCTSLQQIGLPNINSISGSSCFRDCSSLQSLTIPNLSIIDSSFCFEGCSSLQSLIFPNLTILGGDHVFNEVINLQVLITNIEELRRSSAFRLTIGLRFCQFGKLTNIPANFFNEAKPNLRNIIIGNDTDINITFQSWTATNVINEGQSGIDELNSNLYNNLLTKLYDHSNDGEERTLRLGWYNYVSEENKLYAKNKGWNITT